MKVSASIPPDAPARTTPVRAAAVVALAWLAAHLPLLSPSLEDIDSMNFALGLREFDPALHQPHPPGYPVYIALGRVSLAIVSLFWPGSSPIQREALALACWSAIGGAVAIVAAAALFDALRVLDSEPGHAAAGAGWRDPVPWAAALLASAPLFWLSGLRPMTDVPGLAVSLVALAWIVRGLREREWLTAGALVAGLAVGLRSQSVWLTVPVLAVALVMQRRAGIVWLATRPVAALAVGGFAWAVPLVVASGGLDAYLRALGTQASLDFAGVDMVWLNPTPRRIALSVYETFVWPWVSVPLAGGVIVAAGIGAGVQLLRERRALFVLLASFGPYAVFHLLLQETFTARYALPTVPAVAWLAARGLAALGRPGLALAAPLVGVALWTAVPGGLAFGSAPHPAFRAIDAALAQAAKAPPAETHTHFSLWRPLQVVDAAPLHVVPPQYHREWLGLVDYWRGGGRGTVWFFADPLRTDLALIDPAAREDVTHYGWPPAARIELSGTRPLSVDWYRIRPPGWFAGDGWSLTPETGGETSARATGPERAPIDAWIRRRAEPQILMIGSRHLGAAGDPGVSFELAIDGQVRDRWTIDQPLTNALRFLDLPGGLAGEGDYARVTVSARPADGRAAPVPAAVRQFDVQPLSRPVFGFDDGWHELEFDTASGRLWRWSSDRSVLRVRGAGALQLTLTGESPLRYFDAPPLVRVLAGDRVLDQFSPADDFVHTVRIPADALTASGGVITLAQERVYLPGQAEGTADARRLGLRLFEIRIAADTTENARENTVAP